MALQDIHQNYAGLSESFMNNADQIIWKEILEDKNPLDIELPLPYKKICTQFQKILIYNTLRNE